ncbi:MAG: hypothetical protein JRN52_06460 [Nitrososphaerota archaeon]|nr:hypothetical protein [Nitrososphaerota archaeon]
MNRSEPIPTEHKQEATERININLTGEPAKILRELKERGLVQNNVDSVAQGLLALHEKVIRRDLASLRLGLQQEK